jgi:hypothetical protein
LRQYRAIVHTAEAADLPTYSIRFYKRPHDPRTHDLPEATEIIAALCEGDTSTERGVYVYRLNPRGESRHFVKYTDELVDNLTYPLLMPIPIQGQSPLGIY